MNNLRDWQHFLREQLRAVADQPEQETRWLLTAAMHLSPTALLADADRILTDSEQSLLRRLLDARRSGVPLAYCLGEWSFFGFDLAVSPAVLIPRSDSELLVNLALEGTHCEDSLQILDLGTGSGALALALALERPRSRIFAVERSEEALTLARHNGKKLRAPVEWLQGDWFAPLDPAQVFDLILSNPPYLASDDCHLPDLQHEPREALVAGPTGLECFETIISEARTRLRPGGRILLEHGFEQGAAVRRLLCQSGFQQVQTHVDLGGRDRVSSARRD